MDALVHIFYEVAGTAGAFCTALGLIPALGNNMSFIITPICFTLPAITWYFVSNLNFKRPDEGLAAVDRPSYFMSVLNGSILFFKSIWTGAVIIFSSRKFIRLVPGYLSLCTPIATLRTVSLQLSPGDTWAIRHGRRSRLEAPTLVNCSVLASSSCSPI
jgi:hypothetical protein